ncbi:hypothetical protein ES703_112201 [subsurface metagenome]
MALSSVNQLGGYPDTVGGSLDATLQYVLHTKVLCDLLNFHRFAFICEGGVAGNDK